MVVVVVVIRHYMVMLTVRLGETEDEGLCVCALQVWAAFMRCKAI